MSTSISWTDESWNPTTGCHRVSNGCKNCYAAALAPRLAAMGQKGYTDKPWTKANAEENVHLHPDRLEKPLHWKKPRRVFVNSMSDLFHELVPDEFIDRVFAVMALAPHHTFQILTKRPERMAEYLGHESRSSDIWIAQCTVKQFYLRTSKNPDGGIPDLPAWPLPNVWCGTSVENQRAADERIPHLLRTPAAVRFLSCEPLLGPVDLTNVSAARNEVPDYGDALTGTWYPSSGYPPILNNPHIDWVIAGGESGHGFREMDLDWARGLRDQCVAAGIAFWFKQSSGLRPETNALLDGEEWHQFPEEMHAERGRV